MIVKTLLVIASLLVSFEVARAGIFEDGMAANQRGDYASAARNFQSLAMQGDANAQYNLGVLYMNGRGVAQDDFQAVKWYQSAAAQGNWNAQTNLGLMYAHGKGIKQDDVHALMWLILGAVSGYPHSVKNRDTVSLLLTAPQVAQATKMANECKRHNFKGCDALANGTPLTQAMKNDFINGEVPSCVAKQRKAPVNRNIRDSQVMEYCNCAMKQAADLMTVEDMRYAMQTKNYENLRPIMEAAGNQCIESTVK